MKFNFHQILFLLSLFIRIFKREGFYGRSNKGNTQISKLLNEWYKEIRSRNIDNAHCLKEEINSIIHNNEADSNLLLYYHLLDFGYKYLVDNLSISKNSFDKIESFDIPTDNFYLTTTIFIRLFILTQSVIITLLKNSMIKQNFYLNTFLMNLKKRNFITT